MSRITFLRFETEQSPTEKAAQAKENEDLAIAMEYQRQQRSEAKRKRKEKEKEKESEVKSEAEGVEGEKEKERAEKAKERERERAKMSEHLRIHALMTASFVKIRGREKDYVEEYCRHAGRGEPKVETQFIGKEGSKIARKANEFVWRCTITVVIGAATSGVEQIPNFVLRQDVKGKVRKNTIDRAYREFAVNLYKGNI